MTAPAPAGAPRRHIVTVQLEDYFHVTALRPQIGEKQWTRFESRLDQGVDATLELLAEHDVHATFFALGWIGDRYPALIKRVADEGHEIASGGYFHRSPRKMTPQELRENLARARGVLEEASGRRVVGYRCSDGWLGRGDLWVLDHLAEAGYRFDASLCPPLRAGQPWGLPMTVGPIHTPHGRIHEVPMSTVRGLGVNLRISGGNYLRQLPHALMRGGFERWCALTDAPFVLYFHTWEMDPDQPRVTSASWLQSVRQYRNLDKMAWALPTYFERAGFVAIGEWLGIEPEPAPPREESIAEVSADPITGKLPHLPARTPVTVVIPCYNEIDSLPYLKRALEDLSEKGRRRYALRYIFVDDASTDETYARLQATFDARADCRVIRHPHNKGIAGALRTGIRAAGTEVVCSIDADCSYDPLELLNMIEALGDDTDLVTASPYHPDGSVMNVPEWRLFLSRGLSRLYHGVLHHKLATYTACFRVYRRSSVVDLPVEHNDFRGIVELLARLDLAGGRIKEHPTTLQSRIFGHSKMKTARAMAGHLKLLTRVARDRISASREEHSREEHR